MIVIIIATIVVYAITFFNNRLPGSFKAKLRFSLKIIALIPLLISSIDWYQNFNDLDSSYRFFDVRYKDHLSKMQSVLLLAGLVGLSMLLISLRSAWLIWSGIIMLILSFPFWFLLYEIGNGGFHI
jgi:hypothetical protein